MATFHKKTKALNVFNLHTDYGGAYFIPDPNGHIHHMSDEFYKLCKHEGQHGIWKHTCSRDGSWYVNVWSMEVFGPASMYLKIG